ncbi:MAG: hypothetical protein DRJ35_04865 [Thermoprotei archaeon]|nr:MAG: hypothetical protein DRJ35_04865 [Thermoprotei archaeon]
MTKTYLAINPLAIFLLDETGNVTKYKQWRDQAPATLAEKLHFIEEGKLPEELVSFLSENKSEIDILVLEDEELARSISSQLKISVEVETGGNVFRTFRENIVKIVEEKLSIPQAEYYKKLWEISLELTRRKVRKAAEKRDLFIAQAINALDDINKTINLLASRVREWYGLHFPELDDLVDEHEDYLKIVSEIGMRNNFTKEKVE